MERQYNPVAVWQCVIQVTLPLNISGNFDIKS